MQNTPAIFVNGPRQAGKTTLVKRIAENYPNSEYITFDDISSYAAASADPQNFLQITKSPLIIDEVQMVPDLFRELKKQIDALRFAKGKAANGKYILTGSTNIMALPEIARALVGRVSIFTLYQLSACEVVNRSPKFLDFAYAENVNKFDVQNIPYTLEQIISKATFPEIASNPTINSSNWFSSYVTTLIQRDVRSIVEIEKLAALPHMLHVLAARVGGLINEASLARDLGLNVMTMKRYRSLFNALFLVLNLQPWFRNIGKRFVKAQKLYFSDTYLLCYLLGVDIINLRKQDANLFGKVLENFVASELSKQLTLVNNINLFHFRTHDAKEIDFILERADGKIVAIEVKARDYVTLKDFNVIQDLKQSINKDFIKGIILYSGEKIIPFAEDLFAVPLQLLFC
jgi:hypothetical protein